MQKPTLDNLLQGMQKTSEQKGLWLSKCETLLFGKNAVDNTWSFTVYAPLVAQEFVKKIGKAGFGGFKTRLDAQAFFLNVFSEVSNYQPGFKRYIALQTYTLTNLPFEIKGRGGEWRITAPANAFMEKDAFDLVKFMLNSSFNILAHDTTFESKPKALQAIIAAWN